MERKGIILTEDGDIDVSTGAMTIGNTDYQNAALILSAEKGEFKEFPALGAGPVKYIKSTGREAEMRREILLQLSLDGYDSAAVSFDDNKLTIEL